MDQVFDVYGPSFDVDLVPVDHVVPYMYSRRILIFDISKDQDPAIIPTILLKALQATVNEIPILASAVGPAPERNGQAGWCTILPNLPAKLIIKDLTSSLRLTDLAARGFQQDDLLPEVLCAVPGNIARDDINSAIILQANLVQGGLLLAVQVHHFIADGTAITTILRVFSEKCRLVQLSPDAVGGKMLSAGALDRSPLRRGNGRGDINQHAGRILTHNPGMAKWLLGSKRVPSMTHTFRISSASLKALKVAASAPLPEEHGVKVQDFISTNDAVCGLIWRSCLKARYLNDLVLLDEMCSFGTPVEYRQKMHPSLPADFIGNAITAMQADMPIALLIGPTGLVAASHAIRGMVAAVTQDNIADRNEILERIADLRFYELTPVDDLVRHQIFLTSYRAFDHSSFDWGSALKLRAFRLPKGGLANGCAVILPETRDGSWEVSLTLDEDVMESLKDDEIWSKYMTVV